MFTDGLVERRREHLDRSCAPCQTRLVARPAACAGFVDALAASVTHGFDDLALVASTSVGP
jgi:hypothetical protein